jgi:hypothetical protein
MLIETRTVSQYDILLEFDGFLVLEFTTRSIARTVAKLAAIQFELYLGFSER